MGYIKTLPLPPPRCRSVPHQLPPASAVCNHLAFLISTRKGQDNGSKKYAHAISIWHENLNFISKL